VITNQVSGYSRDNYAYEISGLPSSWSESDLSGFLDSIKAGASFFFFTETDITKQDIYARFGSNWENFLSAMSTYPQKNISP
jgi:hypothetical protein